MEDPDTPSILSCPTEERDNIRQRAQQRQKNSRPIRRWSRGDGHGDPQHPETWRLFGLDTLPAQFKRGSPFDENGVHGFPTCVYLEDHVLDFLLQQGVHLNVLSRAYLGDVNADGSIDRSSGSGRRSRGYEVKDSSIKPLT